ncbi:hypothetical protein [Providencia alcalifaciens]|uniref:hypothetical protein n=1 Tax=Providencia alcalifaciens TaxID=126385 RepID=UPI0003E1F64F|nr:hypothetical protein [Providencia alcalifaciens]ETS99764.1 hypothetical protein HMPREF1568_0491 [Providencia alcalifaciens PAL-3]EUD01316.1 hypothetical protein HMPREF1566_3080 [Providencia alcalifaciens PAL-1]
MFGLFRKKEKNNLEEVKELASAIDLYLTKNGESLASLLLLQGRTSSETLMTVVVIVLSEMIINLEFNQLNKETMRSVIISITPFLNKRFKRGYLRPDVYECNLHGIGEIYTYDSQSLGFAFNISDKYEPYTNDTLAKFKGLDI